MQILVLPQPPTLNVMISKARANKYTAAKDKELWTLKLAKLAKASLTPYPAGSKIWIIPEFQYSTTASDPDNMVACLKYILDGLVLAGILPNDSIKVIRPPLVCDFLKIPLKDKRKKTTLRIFDDLNEYKNYAHSIIDKVEN